MANALYPKWKEAIIQATANSALNGSGTTGVYAALIDTGATAGAALVDYSGLPTGTAAEHLLAEVAAQPEPGFSGGLPWRPYKRRPREEAEAILLAVLH